MARIKTSALISDIRGSIGGTTFQQSRGGLVMKNKPYGRHGNTVKRSIETNIMHALQHAWMSLSDTARNTWNIFADYKRVHQNNDSARFLNGQQIFIKYNFYRLLTGRSLQSDPLFAPVDLEQLTVTLSLSLGNLIMTGSRNFDATKEFMIIMITYPLPASINNAGSRYRFIDITYASASFLTISLAYIDVFGRVPTVGETVLYKYRLINTIGLDVLQWQYGKTTFS